MSPASKPSGARAGGATPDEVYTSGMGTASVRMVHEAVEARLSALSGSGEDHVEGEARSLTAAALRPWVDEADRRWTSHPPCAPPLKGTTPHPAGIALPGTGTRPARGATPGTAGAHVLTAGIVRWGAGMSWPSW